MQRFNSLRRKWNEFRDLAQNNRRKFSHEMGAAMQGVGPVDEDLLPMSSAELFVLSQSWCELCGTIQRMFYEGYEERIKEIKDAYKANRKQVSALEKEVSRLDQHLERLKIADKKAREKAKKKAADDKRKEEIAMLQKKLAALKQEEE